VASRVEAGAAGRGRDCAANNGGVEAGRRTVVVDGNVATGSGDGMSRGRGGVGREEFGRTAVGRAGDSSMFVKGSLVSGRRGVWEFVSDTNQPRSRGAANEILILCATHFRKFWRETSKCVHTK